ncbi:MAG: flagellar M-ring protein FliF [Gemmataceae bacterium]|nr:flagellar M-ring protein FliF [Gemmataceae bacterium]
MERSWNIGAQIQALWQQMSAARRVVLVAALVLCLAGIGWLTFSLMRTTYEPVLPPSSAEDVSLAASRLQAKGIAYRLEAGGTTLSVPSAQVAAARVELASSGLAVGKGNELFDESSVLGMTPGLFNVNRVRALQAELERSIAQLEPVAKARVHIVLPEPSPFLRDQKPATASVILKLKPRARLDRSMAGGIIALVSRAVEGLLPENVTVVDARGKLLTEPRSPEDRSTSAQLEYRRQLEAYLASKAEDLLRLHLGSQRAIVRVSAEVDTKLIKEKSETYSPEGKVVVSERLVAQKGTTPPQAKGVAGAGSNLSKPAGPNGNGSTQSETTQTDYAVGKILRETENKLGRVVRLTVAAMIDLSGGEEGRKLSLADARDLVKQAIGYKEGRDEIKVTDVGLGSGPALPAEEEDAGKTKLEDVLSIVRTGCLVLGLLLVAAVVILLWRWVSGRPKERAAGPTDQATLREVEDFQNIARTDPERAARILAMLLGGAG